MSVTAINHMWDVSDCQRLGWPAWADGNRTVAGGCRKRLWPLYSERGFDQTTAAQIAARAGLTERTFFRHFADKREVLFGGSALLQERIVAGVAGAPPEPGPSTPLPVDWRPPPPCSANSDGTCPASDRP